MASARDGECHKEYDGITQGTTAVGLELFPWPVLLYIFDIGTQIFEIFLSIWPSALFSE